MIGFFLTRVRGPYVLGLLVVAFGYGFVLLNVMPQWKQLQAAAGGQEIQERALVQPETISQVLASYDDVTRDAAFQFYLLDVPNFTLLAMLSAAVMAFGLRNLGLARDPFAWVIALPLLAGAFDAVENAALALTLLRPDLTWSSVPASFAITAKRVLVFPLSFPLMALLGVLGLGAWAWRSLFPAGR